MEELANYELMELIKSLESLRETLSCDDTPQNLSLLSLVDEKLIILISKIN